MNGNVILPVHSYAELAAATSFSFLRGASQPAEMVETAIALGHHGLGIADRNSVAGVVRAWRHLRNLREEGIGAAFKLITGARLVFADDTPEMIVYPNTRRGWGRLMRLLTLGNLRAEKGSCILHFEDLIEWAEEWAVILLPSLGAFSPWREAECFARAKTQRRQEELHSPLTLLRNRIPLLWLGASMTRAGRDKRRLAELKTLAAQTGIPLIAINDALYATPETRPLHDIMTCIREGTTIEKAGRLLAANAERHLKPAPEMARLFRDAPEALAEIPRLMDAVNFDLSQLSYEYPHEPVPAGWEPQAWLEHLVMKAANAHHPRGLPPKWVAALGEEFTLIAKMKYAPYFLTVHDIVNFARAQDPPILCQGRGSAANSLVCYLLGVTPIDPIENNLLFTRFLSEERNEPPDIDVDFEHERREEVMQYVYRRYGRERAGIVSTVIHYRPRSTVREVGKALGLTEDITARLASTVWGSWGSAPDDKRLREAGFDPENPELARLNALCGQLLQFPRHLSQHVGGFVLTEDRLDETVPIHNAAMEDRTFIEWDKDDIDALGLMKVDVLALGMLTCIRKAFHMIAGLESRGAPFLTLASVPSEDPAVYDMLCKGDSIGTFQVESRAQINMLPRLRPRAFYDLVVQVAIVRPGPIEGEMVHPYLRRRSGKEPATLPSPGAPHDPNELKDVLGKTFGVPLFQEQAMKLAIVAAGFSNVESNGLRRAMATFRNLGTIQNYKEKFVSGMVSRGYEEDFAQRCFKQIEGFGSYGFPESHAQAFAKIVYVSAWLKRHHPAVFAAALLNSQPMGFYAPAQIVRNAREHGVEVRAADVNESGWDNGVAFGDNPIGCSRISNGGVTSGTVLGISDGAPIMIGETVSEIAEAANVNTSPILTLGFRQIDGFREEWANAITAAQPFTSIEDLARRTGLPARAMKLLADADALRSLGSDRREGGWEVRRLPQGELPLFAAATARELAEEQAVNLPEMQLGEHVAADYQTVRLSLKAHPMEILRPIFARDGILSCARISASKSGARARVAGLVLVRQRPGKGNAIFTTLEDETGVTNVIMWARTFERFRLAVMSARLMEVQGEVQKSPEGVVHLMAHRIVDRSAELATLSEVHQPEVQLSRADEFLRPQPPRMGHPRMVRSFPKSRDFH
jgi:error-prone DNA polymerase